MIRRGIRRLFRLPLRRADVVRRDVEAEIDTHLALRTEQLMARGLPPEAARAEAARLFGALDIDHQALAHAAHHREQRMRMTEFFDAIRHDVTYALRGLRREPLLTAFVVVTFGLGIGANAAMYGVVDRLMLRGPEHVHDANRAVRLSMTVQPRGMRPVNTGSVGYVSYNVMRASTHSFASVAAYAADEQNATFGRGADARLINLGRATAGFFPLLGVQPEAGRFFSSAEDSTTDPQQVVVLGYGLWKRAFGGDRNAIGKTAIIGDAPYTIVGVAPKGFSGADLFRVDAWTPMSGYSRNVTPDWTHSWNAQWLYVVGRLTPGVTGEDAALDATAAHRRAYVGDDSAFAQARFRASPLQYDRDGGEPSETRVARWLIGVAAIMLLIGCANVVNLLLARAVRRRREIAVRLALGVARGRLVRLLLTESLVLAVAGWIAGLGVAYGGGTLIRTVLLPRVEWPSSPVAGRVLAVSLVVSLVVGVVVGLLPALHSSREDLTAALKLGVRDGGARMSRVRGALTIAQAALSVLLLVGAGLFVRSLRRVEVLDLGIQPDRVLTVELRRPALGKIADTVERRLERVGRANVYPALVARLRGLGEVESAAPTIGLPFQTRFSQRVRIPGFDTLPSLGGGGPGVAAVGEDYFQNRRPAGGEGSRVHGR